MSEPAWVESKTTELAEKLGRCVQEMVMGTCPKKTECPHPHLKDRRQFKSKVCYLKLLGECPRNPDDCRFSHVITEADRANAALKKQAEQSKFSSKNICVNEFHQPNSCHKHKVGKCSFRHTITEQERSSPVLKEKMDEK